MAKRIQTDKVLKDKAFKITINPKVNGYDRGLASIVHRFFDKKFSGCVKFMPNQPADELQKPVIRIFKKRRVYSSFKKIFRVDLAHMHLISKYNKGNRF